MKLKLWALLSVLFVTSVESMVKTPQVKAPKTAQQIAAEAAKKIAAQVKGKTAGKKQAAPAKKEQPKAAAKPKSAATPTAKLSSKDTEINAILSKIKDGKLATSALGPLSSLLSKLSAAIMSQEIIDVQTVKKAQLPLEFSQASAIAFQGKITFLKQPVDCMVLIGKEKDAAGKTKLGVSLEIGLTKNYTVKDFNFLTAFGVKGADLGKFGNISMPQPSIIFSTLTSYTNPKTKTAVKAGLTLSTKTQVSSLMKLVRGEVNNLTGGNAKKLPFIAKVSDTTPVTFNVAVGFTGTKL